MGAIADESYSSYITKSFLEEVLQSPIESYELEIGSSPGDNFLCVLYSIKVSFKDAQEPMHLVIKLFPSHPFRKKFLFDTNCFYKEVRMYRDYLPELTAFPKKIGVITPEEGTLRLAYPKFIHGAAADYSKEIECESQCENGGDFALKNYVLMEDIRKTRGFKMADKFKGLGYNHVKLVVEELAKLHALGWAYKNNNGWKKLIDQFPFFVENVFSVKIKEVLDHIATTNLKIIKDVLEKEFGTDSPILQAVLNIEPQFRDYLLKFVEGHPTEKELEDMLRIPSPSNDTEEVNLEPWLVGSHGDIWLNNILFRHDEKTKEPVETILIDLQLCREACPTVDLAYFLYTSTTADFRRKHLDEMLSIYHSRFLYYSKLLESKPYPGFTIENLRCRFHRRKLFGFMCTIFVLPTVLQTPGKNNMEECEVVENGKISDLFQIQRDDNEMQVLSNRFITAAQEAYEQGII